MNRSYLLRTALGLTLGVGGAAFGGAAAAHVADEAAAVGSPGASVVLANSTAAVAAENRGGDGAEYGDIIVTARRRDETSMTAPVTLTAVGREELERQGSASLDNLTRLAPQVMIAEAAGGVQGGTVSIRGIATGDGNLFADQSVTFNIDGVQVARATIRRLSQVDLQQVEVLKGPQALFYGKNSPGGVISIRSADPGDSFEGKVTAGYEVVGRQLTGEGYISGPISDQVKVRLVAFGSTMRGWVTNTAEAPGTYSPAERHPAAQHEYGGRLTVLADPTDALQIKLKVVYGYLNTNGPQYNSQLYYCPSGGGSSALGDRGDCVANNKMFRADMGPVVRGLDARYEDGVPLFTQSQSLSSLAIRYAISPDIELNATTGFYWMRQFFRDNFAQTEVVPYIRTSVWGAVFKELTQEVRLSSSFDGPINFMVGGFVEDSSISGYAVSHNMLHLPTPVTSLNIESNLKTRAWSAYAQLSVELLKGLELSGGGRYSEERKRFGLLQVRTGDATVPVPRASFSNFSPEATLSWKASDVLTLYGSYKTGFLSGGFNFTSASAPYTEQTAKGFEIGAKARLFDSRLRATIAAYDYNVDGLQVTVFNPPLATVLNAGKSSITGVEADLSWRTPVEGLSLRAAMGYNRARFDVFTIQCYRGQTIAQGCNVGQNAAGVYTLQDLAGRQIIRAPKLTQFYGVEYAVNTGQNSRLVTNIDANYSSSYQTQTSYAPGAIQKSFWLLNASAIYTDDGSGLSFGIIGRNLTNKYYFTRSQENFYSGSGQGTNGPATEADLYAGISRGREVQFRVSKSF